MKKIKYSLFLPILLSSFFLFSCGGEGSSSNSSIAGSMSSSNNKESINIPSVIIPEHVHKYQESIEYIDCKSEAIRIMQCECGDSYKETFEPGMDHDFGEWEITIPPMEGKEGEEIRTCTRCNYEESRLVEPLVHQHNYIFTYVVEATCEHEGYTTHECICKDSYNDNFVPIQPHSYGELELLSTPSFDYEGEAIRYCVYNRAHYETITLPILNEEDYQIDAIDPVGCEQGGYCLFTYTYENETITFETYVPAKEHSYGEWQIETYPTNNEKGLLIRYCLHDNNHYETIDLAELSKYWEYDYEVINEANCQSTGLYKLTYVIDGQSFNFDYVSNIDPDTHDLKSEKFDPTCTNQGYTHFYCACGLEYDSLFEEPLNHDYDNFEILTIPTNTTTGEVISYCKNDPTHYITYTLPTLSSHSYSIRTITQPTCETEGIVEYTFANYIEEFQKNISVSFQVNVQASHNYAHIPAQSNTCTDDGWLEHYYCFNCEKYATDSEFENVVSYESLYLPRKNHSYGKWQLLTSPTLTSSGTIIQYCIHDSSHTKPQSLPMLNKTDYTYLTTLQPSCEEKGQGLYTYTIDDLSFSFEVELEKSEHIYTSNHTFYNKNGHYSYCKDCDYKELKTHNFIDSHCQDCNIHESIMLLDFNDNGVRDCDSSATIVYIPSVYEEEEVTSIYDYAFYNCYSLTKVYIPNTITSIDHGVFGGCSELQAIYYASTIENWLNLEIMESLNIPNNISLYCYDRNNNYQLIESVYIDSLSKLNNVKFIGSLKSVTLSHDVGVLAGTLQTYLPNIEKFYFNGNETAWFRTDFSSLEKYYTNYSSPTFDALIYLMKMDGTNEYYLPKYVNVDCETLDYQLYLMGQIEGIYIDINVKNIDNYAFRNTNLLNKVYYKGTLALWNDINFESSSANPMSIADKFYLLKEGVWELVTALKLDNSVEVISKYAFRSFECVTSIIIENENAFINANAFEGCTNVTSLSLPFIGSDKNKTKAKNLGYLFNVYKNQISSSIVELIYSGSKLNSDELDGLDNIVTLKLSNKNISGSLSLPKGIEHIYFEGSLTDWLSNDFYFYENNNQMIHFYLYSTELINVTIPNEISTIPDMKFYNFKCIESVVIPSNVTEIGRSAFANCVSLKTVKLSEGIEKINDFAFYGCISLTNINIPSSLIYFGENVNAFEGCSSLSYYEYNNCYYLGNDNDKYIILMDVIDSKVQELTIHNSTRFIASYAVASCYDLANFVVPESVLSIGTRAFYDCRNINDFTMYASTQTINCTAFNYCQIKRFYYYGTLENYLTIDFANAESSSSLSYETPVSYDTGFYIPDENGEFKPLNHIVVPETITEIGDIQFFRYDYLSTITLHKNITRIGTLAISYIDNLQAIYYNGTIEDFFKIQMDGSITESIQDTNLVYVLDNQGNYVKLDEITSFKIDENVSEVKNLYLSNSTALTDLYIPSSVNSFEEIHYLDSLTNVYYYGTIENWMKIYFDDFKSNPMYYAKNFYMLDENNNWYKVTNITLPNNYHLNPNAFIGFNKTLDTVYIPYIGIINENTDITIASIFGNSEYKISKIVIQNNVEINDLTFKNFKFDSLIFEKDVYMHNSNGGYYNSATDVYIYGKYEGYSSFALNNLYIGNMQAWLSGDVHTSISDFDKNIYVLDENNNWVIPTHIIIPNTITELISMPFKHFKELTSITIPSTITNIESLVFSGCNSLENVYYEGSLEDWCSINFETYQANPMYYAEHFFIKDQNDEYYEVTNIELNDTITEIKLAQFYGFDNVTSITIPNSVVSFGQYAFEGCNSLESLTIPFAGESISSAEGSLGYLFSSNNKIPSSLIEVTFTKKVHDYVCSNVSSIEKVIIGNQIEVIGTSAFSECTNLKEIVLSNSVTTISNYAFSGCQSLESIDIPSSVTTIGNGVFTYCNSLTKVIIPDSVISLGKNLFGSSLQEVTLPFFGTYLGDVETKENEIVSFSESLKKITITQGDIVPNNAFSGINYLEEIILPSELKVIGDSAFSGCSILLKLDIPSLVNEIGINAFGGCRSLTSITIPDNVKVIKQYTFSSCNQLTNITLPQGLTTIENNAMYNCSSLKEIVIPNSVTNIGAFVLNNCKSLEKISIPFIGEKADNPTNNYLGYLFGARNLNSNDLYVPTTIKEVIITGNCDVYSAAFNRLENITKLTLSANIKSFNYSYLPTNISIYFEGTQEQWVEKTNGAIISNPVYFI